MQLLEQVGPTRHLSHAAEVGEGFRLRVENAAIGKAPQHDQCIVRASAERLRPRQHEHQVGIIWLTGLHGSPGERVKGFEIFARGGVQRQLLAVSPPRARRLRLRADDRSQAQ